MRMHLETERLILRDFEPDDTDNLVALDADPEVRRFLDLPFPTSRYEVESVILPRYLEDAARADGFGQWAVVEKQTGTFIGWLHFRRSRQVPEEIELGYRLQRSAWGKGYATEASRALIDRGIREQGVRRITATALAGNAASIRVMEKCGLTFEESWSYNGIPAVKYGLRVP